MRKLLGLSVVGVLIGVSIGSADLETPERQGPKIGIPGMGTRATFRRFKANEEAQAIVSGDGDTCLGLYVFDANGNCVARDDLTAPESSDDLTVKWVPHVAAEYSVEVRNGSTNPNAFEFVLR
jgi:hypothetical protein